MLQQSKHTLKSETGPQVRQAFRKLGLFHMIKREDKIITMDMPFHLKISKDGDMLFIVLYKSRFPRKYSLDNLRNSKSIIEQTLGYPTKIQETHGLFAFCCKINEQDEYPLAV